MDKELLDRIDEKIELYEDSLIKDAVSLININSELGEPFPGAPFGKGAREVLDKVIKMGKEAGFVTKDYNVGVISVAMEEKEPDVGIWAHGDVVPAGTGWEYEPYNATVLDKEFIIGRGAADNKGQLAAIFNLFKIFKELGVKLNYNPALYVGSCEETGMKDLLGIKGNPDAMGFVNVCKVPRLSLVPDGGFPIGYGARGNARFYLRSKTPLHNFSLTAGKSEDPGRAEALFESLDFQGTVKDCEVIREKKIITSFSEPRHGSSPDPSGNMITKITNGLLESGCVDKADLYILSFLRDVSLDVNGRMLGIFCGSELMGETSVYTQSINCENGHPELEIRVNYPIETTYEKMLEKLTEVCDNAGFTVRGIKRHSPYVNDDKNEIVRKLADIANEINGGNGVPYINGSTYAHYLPNAYIYGMSGNVAPAGFKSGRGGVHGIDESVSVLRLKKAMKIYARALLILNETEW